jgi:hypothetical protein
MKHAQRTEKYIRLIFNSYISDDNFFQKSMRIIDKNPAHYTTLNTVSGNYGRSHAGPHQFHQLQF